MFLSYIDVSISHFLSFLFSKSDEKKCPQVSKLDMNSPAEGMAMLLR